MFWFVSAQSVYAGTLLEAVSPVAIDHRARMPKICVCRGGFMSHASSPPNLDLDCPQSPL